MRQSSALNAVESTTIPHRIEKKTNRHARLAVRRNGHSPISGIRSESPLSARPGHVSKQTNKPWEFWRGHAQWQCHDLHPLAGWRGCSTNGRRIYGALGAPRQPQQHDTDSTQYKSLGAAECLRSFSLADVVLAYRPKPKSMPAKKRKRRANKAAKAAGALNHVGAAVDRQPWRLPAAPTTHLFREGPHRYREASGVPFPHPNLLQPRSLAASTAARQGIHVDQMESRLHLIFQIPPESVLGR
jgi:hypothetical protein